MTERPDSMKQSTSTRIEVVFTVVTSADESVSLVRRLGRTMAFTSRHISYYDGTLRISVDDQDPELIKDGLTSESLPAVFRRLADDIGLQLAPGELTGCPDF